MKKYRENGNAPPLWLLFFVFNPNEKRYN